jgi:hypothetical protein
MFLGEIEETLAVLKAQLAAAGFNEAPKVIRKTNPTKIQPVHDNESPHLKEPKLEAMDAVWAQ